MSNGDSTALICPKCGSQNNKVLETRSTKREKCLKRRRLCEECIEVFSTIEIPFDCLKHQYNKEIPDMKALLEFLEK